MIVVDRLCYNSGLRYVNAMAKFVFSMLKLLLCVSSHPCTACHRNVDSGKRRYSPLVLFKANNNPPCFPVP